MGYLTMALGEQATNRRSYHVCAFTVRPAGETCAFSERWNGEIARKSFACRTTAADMRSANRLAPDAA